MTSFFSIAHRTLLEKSKTHKEIQSISKHNTHTLRVCVYPSGYLPPAMSLIMDKVFIYKFFSSTLRGQVYLPVLRSGAVCGM